MFSLRHYLVMAVDELIVSQMVFGIPVLLVDSVPVVRGNAYILRGQTGTVPLPAGVIGLLQLADATGQYRTAPGDARSTPATGGRRPFHAAGHGHSRQN